MIRVADRVWTHWRQAEASSPEPEILLLLATDMPAAVVLQALERAARAATAKIWRELAAESEQGVSTGHWTLAAISEGVLLRIDEEPADFKLLLQQIVANLDAQGIEGRLDVFEPEAQAAVPETRLLLECRLRVAGRREPRAVGKYAWRADPDALRATIDDAVKWCLEGGRFIALGGRLMPPAPLDRDANARELLHAALSHAQHRGVVHLSAADGERFRMMAVDPSRGRVSLIDSHDDLDHEWKRLHAGLKQVMSAVADQLVYGFVKTGTKPNAARLGTSLATDWPRITHFNPFARASEAFEDSFAPDAFGTQLLGPGYFGRIPAGPDWTAGHTTATHVLLEHVNPAAWYRAPLALPDMVAAPEHLPDVLVSARLDFAPILFTDDVRS